MLLHDQRDFYTRWMAKANAIPIDTTENCIDKYVSLYIVYNFLYNIVPTKIAAQNNSRVSYAGDRASAIALVDNYLGSQNIIAHLIVRNNQLDINNLIAIINQQIFNVTINRQGQPQPNNDHRLARHLLSNNISEKLLAVLEILYQVRCNVVHGRKGLHAYQMLILEPVISLLSSLNELLYNTLRALPY